MQRRHWLAAQHANFPGFGFGGLSLLFNDPLDIQIEKRIAAVEALREAQFCSLVLQAPNAAAMGLKPENRAVIPAALNRLNDVITGAMAIFVEHLTCGATDFTAFYAATPTFKLVRQVVALAYEHNGPPGSEYDLADQIAGLLGLRDWYQWRPDPGTFPESLREPGYPIWPSEPESKVSAVPEDPADGLG